MNFFVKVKPREGRAFGNLLRQVCLNNGESWKPIGFHISIEGSTAEDNTTILSSFSEVGFDMLQFSSNLANLSYNLDEGLEQVVEQTYTFSGKLTGADLEKGFVHVSEKDRDKVLLEMVSDSVVYLSIVFCYNSGVRDIRDNKEIIEYTTSLSSKRYNPMSSNHGGHRRVSVKVNSKTTHDLLEIDIRTADGHDEQAIKNFIATVKDFLGKVEDATGIMEF